MRTLRVILGDHLTPGISSLADLDPDRDVVLMVEAEGDARPVRHHKQKIALILSAMRHFAQDLRKDGVTVDYVRMDDDANSGSLTEEVARAVARTNAGEVVVAEPGEWRLLEAMRGWEERLGLPVQIRPDDRFFADRARFDRWAEGRKTYRMEHFYREMRRETGILMDGDRPVGGNWSYDAENRKPLPKGFTPPTRRRFAPDKITTKAMALVRDRFPDNFGDIQPFAWPVTRRDALAARAGAFHRRGAAPVRRPPGRHDGG
jgi:deoxyribodipyrimidine photolyase-related protein